MSLEEKERRFFNLPALPGVLTLNAVTTLRKKLAGLAIAAGAYLMLTLCGSMSARAEITAAERVAHPGMKAWEIDYDKPDEVSEVWIRLSYKFWDPKVDGDVPSGRNLQETLYKATTAHLVVKVFVGSKQSVVVINGKVISSAGKGSLIDSSYIVATEPKTNADGFYILAQKPNDPKNPAAMGDVQEVQSWIQLEISPKQ